MSHIILFIFILTLENLKNVINKYNLNMKKLIFSRRDASEKGVTMHFHNLTSMVLFDQIIRFELTNGVWNKSGKEDDGTWSSPNYYIVGDKSEVSTRFDYIKDFSKIKRNQNLKRILRSQDTLDSCLKLGKFTKAMEVGVIKFLMFDNLAKVLSLLPDSIDKVNDISKLKESISSSNPELSKCVNLLSYEDLEDYYRADYFGKELRDDFGMIQNVMRTDFIKVNNNEKDDEDNDDSELGLPFDYNDED